MRFITLALCIFLFPLVAIGEIKTEEVTYSDGAASLKGYLALPESTEAAPTVIVVHEWWGHNDYVRNRAEMLAKLGYVALAVDMYGEGKTASHPKDAGKFSSEVTKTAGLREKRFRAAMDFLKKRSEVNKEKIAAIGYCFGGNTVIEMARLGIPLTGVVSFHGGLKSGTPVSKMGPPILVLHGAADSFIGEEQIATFKEEMTKAGREMKFVAYDGAKHSFTNPEADTFAKEFGIDVGYDKDADKESWEEMKGFLGSNF